MYFVIEFVLEEQARDQSTANQPFNSFKLKSDCWDSATQQAVPRIIWKLQM